ncbi:hypothetical protein OPU71_16930 [Niveibacterium sp. 24ML]|uniref:hypothetical protein n=1 Tax=Niveibacterium sp. 24ML TaxID=2985512 RepID=UPI0022709790|nr:hypothetical protein [Niveibacterium sp. 24ML]MCX9157810.1 hypothetical protein [Niveibacterium sp. 24ML]
MSAPSVLVLEAAWVSSLEPGPSVRPFIDGWAAHRGVGVCYRSFGSCAELAHWLRHFLASQTLRVAYLAAHGRAGSLHTPTSEIPLPKLAQTLAGSRRSRRVGKGIAFGACHLGAELEAFLFESRQKFDWALGYTEAIPWLGATVIDLLFLEYLFAGIALRPDDTRSDQSEEAEAATWLIGEHCRLADLMGLRLALSASLQPALRPPTSKWPTQTTQPVAHTMICS